jgi:hypothetical protein
VCSQLPQQGPGYVPSPGLARTGGELFGIRHLGEATVSFGWKARSPETLRERIQLASADAEGPSSLVGRLFPLGGPPEEPCQVARVRTESRIVP